MTVAPYIDNTPSGPGLVVLGLQGWIDLLRSQYESIFPGVDFGPDTPDGQWVVTLAGNYDQLEQLLRQVYESRSPAGASGVALSRLVQLNGITRKPATFSTVPVTVTGTPGTLIPVGSLIGSASDTNKPAFATTTTLTIGKGGTAGGIAQCTSAGAVAAAAGELTRILSVISGWAGVTNPSDAVPGMPVESDPLLRARRAVSVALPSQSMLDGLEAALRNMTGVADARVYENTVGVPDARGLPPHSIKVIVRASGATDADIARVIGLKVGMGATTSGTKSATVPDGDGQQKVVRWDVATEVDAFVAVKVSPSSSAGLTFDQQVTLQAQIANAVAAYFGAGGDWPPLVGQSIPWAVLATPINALGLTGRPGLPSVSGIYLGREPNPTTQADLAIAYNEIASFDAQRVVVVT